MIILLEVDGIRGCEAGAQENSIAVCKNIKYPWSNIKPIADELSVLA
jgi:hypothetical protein